MEWKKSNISQNELEKQQQAYIKEALEMAKRSMASQLDKTSEAEKAKKAADEKIAAEKAAAEKAAAEKAAAEKAAAEKAAAERAAAEKAAAERAAAEKAAAEKAAAERAAAERAAAEKAAAEKAAAEKAAAEKTAAEKAAAEKKADEREREEFIKYHELKENVNIEISKDYEEAEEIHDIDKVICSNENISEESGNNIKEDDIIDISRIKNSSDGHRKNTPQNKMPVQKQNNNPPNFNRYINEHNKNQCNCPACQRKRAEQH